MEYVGVKSREVLKANASGYLIVEYAIHTSRQEADGNDLERFHPCSLNSQNK